MVRLCVLVPGWRHTQPHQLPTAQHWRPQTPKNCHGDTADAAAIPCPSSGSPALHAGACSEPHSYQHETGANSRGKPQLRSAACHVPPQARSQAVCQLARIHKPLHCHSHHTNTATLVTQQPATLVTQHPTALVSESPAASSQLTAAAALPAPLHHGLQGKSARRPDRLKAYRGLQCAAWPASSSCVTCTG